jgi:hypothetical protein
MTICIVSGPVVTAEDYTNAFAVDVPRAANPVMDVLELDPRMNRPFSSDVC